MGPIVQLKVATDGPVAIGHLWVIIYWGQRTSGTENRFLKPLFRKEANESIG
jgi:hypothetical protein